MKIEEKGMYNISCGNDIDIINAAKEYEKTTGFSDIVRKAKGVNSASGIGFLEGAVWMKEQMMKDAEPAEIGFWNQRGLSIHFDKSLERLGFDEDEKVKVIIVKKAEK